MSAERPDVMKRRNFDAIRTGDGMRRASVIGALMDAIEAEAAAFAEAHPAGLCRCPLCRTSAIHDMRRDIAEIDAEELRRHVRELVDREIDGE